MLHELRGVTAAPHDGTRERVALGRVVENCHFKRSTTREVQWAVTSKGVADKVTHIVLKSVACVRHAAVKNGGNQRVVARHVSEGKRDTRPWRESDVGARGAAFGSLHVARPGHKVCVFEGLVPPPCSFHEKSMRSQAVVCCCCARRLSQVRRSQEHGRRRREWPASVDCVRKQTPGRSINPVPPQHALSSARGESK